MSTPGTRLTELQGAALAKVACGIEAGAGVAVLCGPAGVGKTTVLEHLASDPRVAPDELPIRDVAAWLADTGDPPPIVLADDAHLASDHDLAQLLARAKSRRPAAAVVLAGQGRLLTLASRDRRIEQAVRIRAALLPGSLAHTLALVAAIEPAGGPGFDEAALVAIHEIAGGVPGDVVRLAELAGLVAPELAHGLITADDIEAVHRRLTPQAA
jgi:type II secretory pathway predicted ATPase ExeA